MKRDWLINKRKALKLTQQDLAKEAFMDRGYYSQIENGKRNPSPEVAYNIAKALDFDPMLFFKYRSQIEIEPESSLKITDRFENMKIGKIVYLYNEFNKYFNNIVTFIVKGLENKSYCLIIESPVNIEQIRKTVYDVLPQNELDQYLVFINKEDFINLSIKEAVHQFLSILNKFDPSDLIRVWSPKDSSEEYAKNEGQLDEYRDQLITRQILYVSSYNATAISASDHINMMRHFKYIMTDNEIVESPLYDPSNKFILPSLFIQENI